VRKVITRIVAWDDLDLADGTETEADKAGTLAWAGRSVDLDLTGDHHDQLTKLLAPYFKAGRRSADRTSKLPDSQRLRQPPTPLARARRYNDEMATWAAAQGLPFTAADKASGRKRVFPTETQHAFAEHLRREGISAWWIPDRTA